MSKKWKSAGIFQDGGPGRAYTNDYFNTLLLDTCIIYMQSFSF